jgi:hypothetical protein
MQSERQKGRLDITFYKVIGNIRLQWCSGGLNRKLRAAPLATA